MQQLSILYLYSSYRSKKSRFWTLVSIPLVLTSGCPEHSCLQWDDSRNPACELHQQPSPGGPWHSVRTAGALLQSYPFWKLSPAIYTAISTNSYFKDCLFPILTQLMDFRMSLINYTQKFASYTDNYKYPWAQNEFCIHTQMNCPNIKYEWKFQNCNFLFSKCKAAVFWFHFFLNTW